MKDRRPKTVDRRPKAVKLVLLLTAACWMLMMVFSVFAAEQFFEIRAKKFSYNPNIIRVNRGDLVRIRLVSEDVTHGLFLDGYGLNASAHPGQDANLAFVADKTGRFSYRCSVTCGEFHPYMIGYLIVEPNTRFLGYMWLIILAAGLSAVFVMRNKKEARGEAASKHKGPQAG